MVGNCPFSEKLKLGTDFFLNMQIRKYVLTAIGGNLLYLLYFWVGLEINQNYLFVLVISEILWMASIFPVYRTFVFTSKGNFLPDLVKFISVTISGLAANFVGTPILVSGFGVSPHIAVVVVATGVGIYSLLMNYFFTFRKRKYFGGRIRK